MEKKQYNSIHSWLRINKKGDICEICKCKGKKLDNALKEGFKYEKNIDNFMKLCRKCHYHYDHPNGFKHTEYSKLKIGLASAERIIKKGVSEKFIYSKKGKITTQTTRIKQSLSKKSNHPQSKIVVNTENGIEYKNAKEASLLLNLKYNSLCAMLRGQNPNKTKLKWKN